MIGRESMGTAARLVAAVGKFRRFGRRWLLRRLQEEVRIPTSDPSRFVRDCLAAMQTFGLAVRSHLGRMAVPATAHRETLFFFYDLDVAPITFDIVSQLVLAELERRRRGLATIHAVLVPGRRLVEEEAIYQQAVGPEQRRARLDGILLPALRLLPQCTGLTLCSSRAEAMELRATIARNVFPPDYTPSFPQIVPHRMVRDRARAGETVFPMLSAAPAAKQTVRRFLELRIGNRKPVVITLRQYAYMTGRNSRMSEWLAFADNLNHDRFAAVIVRDTEQAADIPAPGLERHTLCDAAAWTLDLRMALYEMAYLNLATMHGPMELCWYNERCRYGVFIEVDSAPQTSRASLKENGFDLGQPLPFAKPWQRWYWEPDRLPGITRAFNELSALIDAGSPEDPIAAPTALHAPGMTAPTPLRISASIRESDEFHMSADQTNPSRVFDPPAC